MDISDFELIKLIFSKCQKQDETNTLFYYIINILKSHNIINLPNNIIKYDDSNNKMIIPKFYTNTPLSAPRYSIEFIEDKCLGSGAFGSVYLAKNLVDYKEYAIKKIFVNNNALEINNTLSEIYILSGLKHENIIRYFHSWIEPVFNYEKKNIDCSISYSTQSSYNSDSCSDLNSSFSLSSSNSILSNTDESNLGFIFFIQTEYCNFDTLNFFLKNRACIDYDNNISIIFSIIKALKYIHTQSIVHRDLKPANIFRNNNEIKLGDFGLSTFSDISYMNSSIGSLLYLDPIIDSNKKCTTKMDIYSLGVIITELFIIFNTESERYVILNNLKKNIVPDEIYNKFPDIYYIINKCINNNYSIRYDINELYSIFESILNRTIHSSLE